MHYYGCNAYKIKIQSKDSPVKYSRNNQKNCAVASMRLSKQLIDVIKGNEEICSYPKVQEKLKSTRRICH